jgi:transposase InsO family protein
MCCGIQFTTPGGGGSAVPLIKEAMANGERFLAHAFEYACARNDIDHRTTKPKHPWTNGQVERMNRTIKEATVKRASTTRPMTSYASASQASWRHTTGHLQKPLAKMVLI